MKWDQDAFNRNIKYLIQTKCDGVQNRFNDVFGRDAATRWQTQRPSLEKILEVAEHFGCSLEWLMTGVEGNGLQTPILQPHPIPVISWVHAGEFAESEDHWPSGVSSEEDPVFSYIKVGLHAFGLRVEGDSMLPRFMPGDIAIVDPEQRCDNGSPCVVWVNGEVSLKLFWDKETEIVLKSMNDKYPDTIIKKDSKVDFRVIGKVVDIKAKF